MTSSHVLLVAGAVSYDYLVYPQMDVPDEGDDASQLVIRTGAADLVAQLLTKAAPTWAFEVLGPTLQPPRSNCLKHKASSVVDLNGSDSSFRVIRKRTVGRTAVWHAPPVEQTNNFKSSTVIISGSGEALQDVEPALDFLQRVRPKFIIHHMTKPLARGRLWDIIRDGPRTRDGIPDPDHLAVIINAEDLRAEGISLSRGLSWEKTAEDFVRNLGSNGRLDTLVTCPNLIVRFGNQGIIHHRGREAVNPQLYFNPRLIENGNQGGKASDMIGQASAFTAGFTLGFAKSSPPDTEKAIRLGISATQKMNQIGFIRSSTDEAPDYPTDAIVDGLAPEKTFSVVGIPSGRISSGDSWSIFDAT